MPYKNLESKQQWEREHREQRNAKRRKRNGVGLTDATIPITAPDPRFQKGMASAFNMVSSPEQRSPFLEVGYVIAFLVAFCFGIGLAMYFVRAGKAATKMLPDPDNSKAVPKS
jgi:hypothetical protein